MARNLRLSLTSVAAERESGAHLVDKIIVVEVVSLAELLVSYRAR
jgi:hypothetical protein